MKITDFLRSGTPPTFNALADFLDLIFPVGSVLQTFASSAPTYFLALAGGTIGNASSGATTRANADVENLYRFLWDNLANSEAAVSTGRGASAAADFAANKTLTLPDCRQKFLLNKSASGTGSTLGGTGGNINHTHSVPAHYHSSTATGADLAVSVNAYQNSTNFGSNSFLGRINTAAGSQSNLSFSSGSGITGKVGLVTGGSNGDSAMTSGTGNPPFLTINAYIRY